MAIPCSVQWIGRQTRILSADSLSSTPVQTGASYLTNSALQRSKLHAVQIHPLKRPITPGQRPSNVRGLAFRDLIEKIADVRLLHQIAVIR